MPRKSIGALIVNGDPPPLKPPADLDKVERRLFIELAAAVSPHHFLESDTPLLCRYVEAVAMSNHAAKKLRADIRHGRPSQWLKTQERLTKLLITLGRQLRLSPLSRKQVAPMPTSKPSTPPPWE